MHSIKEKNTHFKTQIKGLFNQFIGIFIIPLISTVITVYSFLIAYELLIIKKAAAYFLLISTLIIWYKALKRSVIIFQENKKTQKETDSKNNIKTLLDTLNNKKNKVYHDIKMESSMLDHLIISTKGLFILETKSYFQGQNEKLKIEFEKSKLFVNDKINEEIIFKINFYSHKIIEKLKPLWEKDLEITKVILFPYRLTEEPFYPIKEDKLFISHQKGFKKEFDESTDIFSNEEFQKLNTLIKEVLI